MIYRLTYGTVDTESEGILESALKKLKKSNKFIELDVNNLKENAQLRDLFEDEEFTKETKDNYEVITLKRREKVEGYYFGFGDKVGPFDRDGRKYTFWNTDNFTHHPSADPLYKSFPFYIFISKDFKSIYGCFTDYPGWMEIDLNSNNDGFITFKLRGSGFNQYIITGKKIHEIVKQYIMLTGKNIAFPSWAFGYQQSRWSYFDQEEVLQIAKSFRKKNIPCDVIYLDIDYMDSYKVFTWNPMAFSKYPQMIKKLHKDGFKIISILDPGVKVEKGYKIFEEGRGKYFLKNRNGEDFEGAVWPGRVRFPDFRSVKVRKWWGKHAKRYLEDGIDGFWNDMNEIAIFATEEDIQKAREKLEGAKLEDGIKLAGLLGEIGEIGRKGHGDDIVHLDGTPHWKVKNTYGFNMIRATSETIQRENKRPFLITRSAYSGVQRYGGVWTGDNHSWWEHILQEIIRINSLSLVGVFYSGFDVGGFGADVNAQMLIRFMQLGMFMPMFRNHSAIGTRRQEPWQFGEDVEAILRKIINYRYRLIPYIYTQYMMGIKEDKPLVRPLFFDYNNEETLKIEDQFLFGNDIVVAPVYRPNVEKRLVWLPEKSINIFDEKSYKKGWNIVDTPIDYIPAFQIIDTAIPTTEPKEFVNFEKIDKVEWKVYLKKKAIGYLYEDDGATNNYKKGIYNLKKVTITDKAIKIQTLQGKYPVLTRLWVFEITNQKGEKKKLELEVESNGEYTIPIQ